MYEIRFHGRGNQDTVIGSKSLTKDFLLMRQIEHFAQIVNNNELLKSQNSTAK